MANVEGHSTFTNNVDVAPGAAQSYPDNHRHVRDGLQSFLRVVGILSLIGGFITAWAILGSVGNYAMASGAAGMMVASTIGSGILTFFAFWIAAAIIDALRVMAANSFREEVAVTPEADPSAQTPSPPH